MSEEKMRNICVIQCGLDKWDIKSISSSTADYKTSLSEEEFNHLINEANNYSKIVEKEGKEVFKVIENCLICEDGYYLVVYEDSIQKT